SDHPRVRGVVTAAAPGPAAGGPEARGPGSSGKAPGPEEAQPMAVINVVQAVRDALAEEMRADPRVMVLGEDVGVRGGVFRATQGLLEEFGEDRVMDTPISESAIVGVAIGAALNGMRPVAEIQFADFIHSAVDQIVSEAAKIRYRSRGDFSCPIVVRAPYGAGVQGALYHSQSVEALF